MYAFSRDDGTFARAYTEKCKKKGRRSGTPAEITSQMTREMWESRISDDESLAEILIIAKPSKPP